MRRVALAAPALAAALLLVGCNTPLPVTPVQGTVTFADRRPADNLLLQFHPTGPSTGQKPLSGSAVTNKDGKYVVTCDDGRDGLPAGNYVVTVIDNKLAVGDDNPNTVVPASRVGPLYLRIDKENPLKITVEPGKAVYDLKLD